MSQYSKFAVSNQDSTVAENIEDFVKENQVHNLGDCLYFLGVTIIKVESFKTKYQSKQQDILCIFKELIINIHN